MFIKVYRFDSVICFEHVLQVMLFTPVSSDLAQANMKAMKESQSANRPILRKASSLAAPQFVDEIRYYLYYCKVMAG